jgi:rRNA-processing protein FCF1
MSDKEVKDFDVFFRASIYPEAEGIFSFRPRLLAQIKDDCLVILDTNALLVPYTTGKDSLVQIGKIYKSLVAANRLVVPGQVAREFAEHRVTKLKELYQQISRKKPTLNLGSYPLLDNVGEYQKAIELEKQLSDSISEYGKAITGILDVISEWYWNDPVSALYGELFAAGVVLDPSFDDKAIRERLDKDTRYKLPPGYKDARKDDQGIGDLLIWQSILEVGKSHKKSVIFISLDQKSDWLSQSEGRALYPRFELIDEFRRNSGGNSFHIVRFSNFLNLFGASENVIEEVRKEEAQTLIESTQPPNATSNMKYFQGAQQMFKVDYICSACGTSITELPFQPSPSRISTLRCSDCHRAERQQWSSFKGGRY